MKSSKKCDIITPADKKEVDDEDCSVDRNSLYSNGKSKKDLNSKKVSDFRLNTHINEKVIVKCSYDDFEKNIGYTTSETNVSSNPLPSQEKKVVKCSSEYLEESNPVQSNNLILNIAQDLQPLKIFNPKGVINSCSASDSLTLDQKNIIIDMCKNTTFYKDNQSTNPTNLTVEKSYTENSTLERIEYLKSLDIKKCPINSKSNIDWDDFFNSLINQNSEQKLHCHVDNNALKLEESKKKLVSDSHPDDSSADIGGICQEIEKSKHFTSIIRKEVNNPDSKENINEKSDIDEDLDELEEASVFMVSEFLDEENKKLENVKRRLDDLENFTIQNYTTLQLIYDLIVEIQKFSEDLALIFPERLTTPIVKFNAYKLAKYWKTCEKTTENRLYNINKNPNWFSISINSKLFTDLENNLIEQFGIEKSKKCIQIMEDYEYKKLSGLEFNNRFLEELGRISGDIKLTPEEFSVICGFSKGFMWELKSKITNSKHRDYNPNYKFSIEALDQIKDLLNYYFGEKPKRCIDLIKKYIISNKKDMKEYRRQQHNVGKPHFFQEIKTTEQAYWLGFIAHDGWLIIGTYAIGIELNVKDRAHLLKFAKVIDLDLDKNDIKDYIKRRIYNGELKESIYSLVQFGCKLMYQELQEISGIGSKADQKNVPQVVKNWITEAKSEAKELGIDWKYTDSGKKALAWLYGMYDADGTLREGNTGRIYSSIKSYLLEIKELFDIRGEVLTQIEPGEELEVFGRSIIVKGMFKLHLSSDIYIPMVQSYMYGLSRKNSYQPTSNEDDFLSY